MRGDDEYPVQEWQEAGPLRRWLLGQVEVIEFEDGVQTCMLIELMVRADSVQIGVPSVSSSSNKERGSKPSNLFIVRCC